ncbi:pinensin family lanthipeptide [Enterococcus wangshanyuanii]
MFLKELKLKSFVTNLINEVTNCFF